MITSHSSHRRRRRLRLAVLPVSLGLIAASSGEATGSGEQVVLTFVGPEAPESMEPVIAAFEALNPDIDVQYESVPFNDLNSIIQTRVGGGDSDPDVFTADQPRIAALVDRGLLLDITDQVGEIDDVVIASSIEASTVDERLYALPISTSTQLLYYNTALLEAADIAPPSIDPAERLTWEQVRLTPKPPRQPAPSSD